MSIRLTRVVTGAIALLTLAPGVRAHEGHGNPQWLGSALHYVLEPVHLPLTVGVLALVILTVRRARRAAGNRDR